MRIGTVWIIAALLFAATVVFWTAPSAAQERIGRASSIRNQVEGVVSGSTRAIDAGGDVFLNELVRTGDDAVAQLLFLDDTDLGVGPRSEVTLDRFLYNPNRSTGSVVVRATQGVFRFVTGSQRPQNYLIQTPIAAIGVRGTVFDLVVASDRIVILLRSGSLRITTQQGRVILLRAGGVLTVFANGTFTRQAVWLGGTPTDFAALFGPAPVQLAHGAEPLKRLRAAPTPAAFPHARLTEATGAAWSGAFIGGQLTGSWSHVTTSELDLITDVTTDFDDTGGSFGGGVNGGYNWVPRSDFLVGVLFDANLLDDRVSHTFAGGTFIRSTVNFTGSALVRAGMLTTPTTLWYLQSGISVAHQRLELNFGGPVTDESQFTPGFTAGFGVEYRAPAFLPRGTSLFLSYEHTWWLLAKLNMPAASPLSDFTWRRESDVIEAGLRFRFDSFADAPLAPPIPFKAPLK